MHRFREVTYYFLDTVRLMEHRNGTVEFLFREGTFPENGTNVLYFVDRAPLYILVNKANLVHSLFLVYLSMSTCFERLCAHHQEKQLCLCDTQYLLFCVDDCLLCRVHPAYKLCTKLAFFYKMAQIVHQVGFVYKMAQSCCIF
jgi:hypothetical protein